MNGESPHTEGNDKAEATQVVKPSQNQNDVPAKPAQEIAVSLHDTDSEKITPQADTAAQKPAEASSSDPVAEVTPLAPSDKPAVAPTEVQMPQPVEPASPWSTSVDANDVSAGYDTQPDLPVPEVHWTASEFIAHEKSPLWYLALAGIAAVLIVFAIFVVHDTVAVVSIFLITILFGAVASHKPRILQYSIDDNGITMGKKLFPYSEFKSFGVVKEEAFSNVTLMPLKRFSPPLTIYYPPEEEDNIVQVLAVYLPIAPVSSDMIDSLLRRIRL